MGYYMYHGGQNPEGKLTPLNESQATGYPNDLPVKNYDFNAPLGEYGQINLQYHWLRRLHLFLHDFGGALAPMPVFLPDRQPTNKADLATLRWAVRSDGRRGFVFVNNRRAWSPSIAKAGTSGAQRWNSRCQLVTSGLGQTSNTLRISPRRSKRRIAVIACMVFPSPISSARIAACRGKRNATPSNWKGNGCNGIANSRSASRASKGGCRR